MKVSRKIDSFNPVTLELESEAEVRLFIGLLDALPPSAAKAATGSHIDVNCMLQSLKRVSGLSNWYAFEIIKPHGSKA